MQIEKRQGRFRVVGGKRQRPSKDAVLAAARQLVEDGLVLPIQVLALQVGQPRTGIRVEVCRKLGRSLREAHNGYGKGGGEGNDPLNLAASGHAPDYPYPTELRPGSGRNGEV